MRDIGAVILAAGGSSRFGRPKQLLTFRGETFVRRAVRAAMEAGCSPVIVVIADHPDAIRSEADIRDSRISSAIGARDSRRGGGGIEIGDVIFVENPEWRNGIGTSIRRGLERLPDSVEGAVLLVCDQPFVDASVVGELIAARRKSGRAIAASSYANTLGVPALFARSCFAALLALPDDSGAKKLFAERRDEVASIAFEDGAIDIDTPEDFARLES